MSEGTLFELPACEEGASSAPTGPKEARVLRPKREQLQWAAVDLESLVPLDHPARAIWGFWEKLDLSAFYEPIKAVVDRPGRPTTDPEVLLALWLLATVEGIGSARRLARLCEEHDAYRWVRGHVPINYHMLSDFRVAHQEALDDLLTQIIGSLMAAGAVTLERVAQDGMRVRASAGAASFRGKQGLEGCLEKARVQVERLVQEREHPDLGVTRRERGARERAAREREERVQQALGYLPQAKAKKERQRHTKAKAQRSKVTKARVSTTDPQARVMKMPDGGFRPAYNVELATDSAKGVIVGVAVTSEGTDAGQAAPMEEQVVRRTDQHPDSYLNGRRLCYPGGHHHSGATSCDRVRAGTPPAKQAGARALPTPLRGWTGSNHVEATDVHRGGQSRIQAKGLYGRMDQCSGTSSRSVPIQRTRACQSHQRYAACRRSPQPPALGGVVGVSRHSGEPQSPGGDIARKVAKALSQCRLPQRIPNSLKLANAFSSTTIALTTKGTSKHSQALRVIGCCQDVANAHHPHVLAEGPRYIT